MNNFWRKTADEARKKNEPIFILAPMEAVTDIVFRETVAHAGVIAARDNGGKISENIPDVMMTEFTNTKSFCMEKGEFSTRGRLVFEKDENENGRNLVVQIWGNEPENFREMSKKMFEKGFSGVDVNMGCPDKSVVKTGAGSGLINPKNRENAIKILRETQNGFYDFARENAGDFPNKLNINRDEFAKLSDNEIREILPPTEIPVSVKTRLGSVNSSEFREWLPVLLRENPANLTIHLRSRKEMSKVPAHFDLIPEISKIRDEISPRTLLTINGDILDKSAGILLAKKYPEIDGVMIGRGIFNNPFAFTNLLEPSREQLFELLRFQLDKYDEFREITEWNGKIITRKFEPLKHFFKIYTNGFDGAKKLREIMMAAKTTGEVREIMDEFEKNNRGL